MCDIHRYKVSAFDTSTFVVGLCFQDARPPGGHGANQAQLGFDWGSSYWDALIFQL